MTAVLPGLPEKCPCLDFIHTVTHRKMVIFYPVKKQVPECSMICVRLLQLNLCITHSDRVLLRLDPLFFWSCRRRDRQTSFPSMLSRSAVLNVLLHQVKFLTNLFLAEQSAEGAIRPLRSNGASELCERRVGNYFKSEQQRCEGLLGGNVVADCRERSEWLKGYIGINGLCHQRVAVFGVFRHKGVAVCATKGSWITV